MIATFRETASRKQCQEGQRLHSAQRLQQSFIGCSQKTANFGSCAMATADMHAQKRNFSIILSCPSMSSRTGVGTLFSGIISGS